jgi:signal transduction histidine kinase
MRERAERIGGNLTIASSQGTGTTVTVVVPGRIAYRRPRRAPRVTSLPPSD